MFRSPPSLAIPTTLCKDGWGHRLGKWGWGVEEGWSGDPEKALTKFSMTAYISVDV